MTTSKDVVKRLFESLPSGYDGTDHTPETASDKNSVYFILKNVDSGFAKDLVNAMFQKTMTSKRWFWAIKIAGESINKKKVQLDFASIAKLFANAAEHLKYPKVRLQTSEGQDVCLSRAGSRSRNPGMINVTDGKRYGENQFFGKIDLDGEFSPRNCTSDSIVDLLKQFSDDPETVASNYGRLTGSCCFCRRGLTDARSTDVGYGPVCAGHYGLEWG